MSATQLDARQKKFESQMILLAQQLGSRLSSAVSSDTTDAMSNRLNRLAAVESVKKTQLHQPTQDTPTTIDSRWAFQETWSNHDWIDVTQAAGSAIKLDQQQTKISTAFTAALGRATDGVITRAMGNAVTTGETGGSTSNFPSANQVSISSHENDPQGGSGNVALTTYKLMTAAQLIGANGGSIDGMLNVALRMRQWTKLLADTRFASLLYNTDAPLARGPGYMGTWGQFRFFVLADAVCTLANVMLSSTNDLVYVFAPEAIEFRVLEPLVTRATEDKDHHYDIDLYARTTVGAGRAQDEKIVQITCDPTAL